MKASFDGAGHPFDDRSRRIKEQGAFARLLPERHRAAAA
jgi:hypothetical protein